MYREIGRARAAFNVLVAAAVLCGGCWIAYLAALRQHDPARTSLVRVDFERVAGLRRGDPVWMQGLDIGVVESIAPPRLPGAPVRVVLRVDAGVSALIRSDATAGIGSRSALGGQVVEIELGRPDAPPRGLEEAIIARPTRGLNELIASSQSALERLNQAAGAAEEGLSELTAVASAIRRGDGTIGRLVNDPEAYDRLLALEARSAKVLSALGDNLEAIQRVWPISSYFDQRGYHDRAQALFQPGAEGECTVIPCETLFEADRAVLTARGRERLDAFAREFRRLDRPGSELVIASFAAPSVARPPEQSRILTDDRAAAVRAYLVAKHSLHTIAPFRNRRIAAFGSDAGESGSGSVDRNKPADRVEIWIFTKQT
jgi:phospholipid/cholesterol/gamma-HCH transport system substrate-binding protein